MAHQIHYNESTGKHSFFSVKEKAWHGLGQVISDYPTSKEALQFAGLDYRVEKRNLFTPSPDRHMENSIPVPDYYATVRTDTQDVLGVVGKDYEIVQNTDAFSFFDAIVGGDGIQYETAGALGKGERIFITAKLPTYIRVGKEDLIDQYLFLTTSHNGYGSITAAFTPVRIVCNNTLNAAMRNHTNTVKTRHTSHAQERLATAHHIMGISNQLSAQLEQLLNHWARTPITDTEVQKLIRMAMAPNKEILQDLRQGKENDLSRVFANVCDNAFDYAMTNPTQQMSTTRGTVFGAYNAITGYFQHCKNYKNQEAKLTSIMYGGSAQIKSQKAFSLCEAFAAKGSAALN